MMSTHFTLPTPPPGRWLAALVSSLVLWVVAYTQAPASGTSLASYEVANCPPAGRGRLARWLLNDPDNTVALHQLAAGHTGIMLASASQLAAGTGPDARLAGQK